MNNIKHDAFIWYDEMFKNCVYGFDTSKKNTLEEVENYIISGKYKNNQKKGAVVIFWKNGKKTIATVDENDDFDKEFGFLLAVFKYVLENNKVSKNSYKREMSFIKEDKIKDYLLEKINRITFDDLDKTRRFLNNLKVTGKKEKIYV